jgi:hypothetical protein
MLTLIFVLNFRQNNDHGDEAAKLVPRKRSIRSIWCGEDLGGCARFTCFPWNCRLYCILIIERLLGLERQE